MNARFAKFMAMGLLSLTAACEPAGEENNGTDNNGVTNNGMNNGEVDMGRDTDVPDTGTDMKGDVAVSCDVVHFSPRTIVAEDGGVVTLEYSCSGTVEGGSVEMPYSLTFASGTVADATVTLPLTFEADAEGRLGTNTVDIDIPTSEFQAGGATLALTDVKEPGVSVNWGSATSSGMLVRLRQRPDLLTAEWDSLVDVSMPRDEPLSSKRWVRDYEASGVPSILDVWHEGTKLRVQRLVGDAMGNFTSHPIEEFDIGVDEAATAGSEGFYLARRVGAADDSELTAYWYALDQTTNSLKVAALPLDSGNLGAAVLLDTFGTGLPEPKVILDVEIVDDGSLQTTESPELIVLYRGEQDFNGVFAAATTRLDTQSFVHSVYPNLGDILPDQEAADLVRVGLMRGHLGSTNALDAVHPDSLRAWTLGKTSATAELEVRRVVLFGGEAGLTKGSMTIPGVDPAEADFHMEVVDVDGDTDNDIVVSSHLADSPKLFVIKLNDVGDFGAGESVSGDGVVRPNRNDAERTQIRLEKRLGRVVHTGNEYPFLQEVGAELSLAQTQFVATTGEMEVNGRPIAVEIAWTFETTPAQVAFVAPINVGTKAELADYMAGSSGLAVGTTSRGGTSLSVRNTQDTVLVASHSNGTQVHMMAGPGGIPGLGVSGPIVGGDNVMGSGHNMTREVTIFEDIASSTTFVLARLDAPSDLFGKFSIWQVGPSELIGPASLTFPKNGKAYQLLTASDDMIRFASVGDGEYRGFTLDPANLVAATQNKGAVTVTEGDLKVYGGSVGTDVPPSFKKRLKKQGGRVRPESARKRTSLWEVDQGFNTAVPIVTVLRKDDGDDCPYQVVAMPTDPDSAPFVTLGEGSMDGCWDLPAVVAVGDVCGVGGEQFVTAAAVDVAGDVWQWQLALVSSTGTKMIATELGHVDMPSEVVPDVTVTDINGDGLADIATFVPEYTGANGKAGGQTLWLYSDGMGGALNAEAEVIPALSSVVRDLPGAGPGLPGGTFGCGNGLMCAFGKGTRNTCSSTSSRPELL